MGYLLRKGILASAGGVGGLFDGTSFKGYWENVSGSRLVDSSPNGNTLTNNGAFPYASGVGGGQAMDMTPVDYASSVSSDFAPGSTDFSFGCFVNFDSLGTGATFLMSKFLSVGNERGFILLYDDDPGFIRANISDNGTDLNILDYSITLNTGTWYHLGTTVELGVAIRLYLDGLEVANLTTGIKSTIHPTTADLAIGSGNAFNPGNSTDGQIAYPFLATKVFSDAEMLALYNSGNGLTAAEIAFT